MRMIILLSSFLVLVSCIVMAIMLIKEKKRILSPYMLLTVITLFVSLFMILKMFGVL
ncbi:MAG: hypothetical protein IJZ35_01640 [Clostridia bacterium]|nr:hypothetical protein [Clostridia bacterium]